MRTKEFIVVSAIVVIGYSITFLVNIYFEFARYCMLLMNWALIFFYCLFLRKKLPQDYYKYNSIDRCTQYSIIFAIFFLFTCSLWFFTGEYNKIIGRIGLLPFLFSMVGIMFFAFVKKVNNKSYVNLRPYLWIYLRCIMILFSNIFIVSMLNYSYKALYVNEKLTYKLIRDGGDVYETSYNDSILMYQTKVHIVDKKDKIDYIIYYDEYPDKIHRIDTLFPQKIQ